MSIVHTEHVLVVPTQLLHDLGYFQGFHDDTDRYLERLLDAANTSYRPRDEMERDPSFKQLIPYCIFRCNGQVFHYRRGTEQGEVRPVGRGAQHSGLRAEVRLVEDGTVAVIPDAGLRTAES